MPSTWVSGTGTNPEQPTDSVDSPPHEGHDCDSGGGQLPPSTLPWVQHVCPVEVLKWSSPHNGPVR